MEDYEPMPAPRDEDFAKGGDRFRKDGKKGGKKFGKRIGKFLVGAAVLFGVICTLRRLRRICKRRERMLPLRQ